MMPHLCSNVTVPPQLGWRGRGEETVGLARGSKRPTSRQERGGGWRQERQEGESKRVWCAEALGGMRGCVMSDDEDKAEECIASLIKPLPSRGVVDAGMSPGDLTLLHVHTELLVEVVVEEELSVPGRMRRLDDVVCGSVWQVKRRCVEEGQDTAGQEGGRNDSFSAHVNVVQSREPVLHMEIQEVPANCPQHQQHAAADDAMQASSTESWRRELLERNGISPVKSRFSTHNRLGSGENGASGDGEAVGVGYEEAVGGKKEEGQGNGGEDDVGDGDASGDGGAGAGQNETCHGEGNTPENGDSRAVSPDPGASAETVAVTEVPQWMQDRGVSPMKKLNMKR